MISSKTLFYFGMNNYIYVWYWFPQYEYKTKNSFRGIYSELTTNYRGENRFHFSVRFDARLNGLGIINVPLSSDLKNEIETSFHGGNPSIFQVHAPTSDVFSIPG